MFFNCIVVCILISSYVTILLNRGDDCCLLFIFTVNFLSWPYFFRTNHLWLEVAKCISLTTLLRFHPRSMLYVWHLIFCQIVNDIPAFRAYISCHGGGSFEHNSLILSACNFIIALHTAESFLRYRQSLLRKPEGAPQRCIGRHVFVLCWK